MRHITFAGVNRILWMALGISFSVVSTIMLMLPLTLAESGGTSLLWLAGTSTAAGGFLLARYIADYLQRAFASAGPDSYYRCVGVAMWHAAVAGMLLGAVVMALLFTQAMLFGLIFPEVSFPVMVINSLIIGASYGIMLGLMTGFITGAVAAYQLSRGEDPGAEPARPESAGEKQGEKGGGKK